MFTRTGLCKSSHYSTHRLDLWYPHKSYSGLVEEDPSSRDSNGSEHSEQLILILVSDRFAVYGQKPPNFAHDEELEMEVDTYGEV